MLIGGTLGTIAGTLVYGGSNHWIRPCGLILAGIFLLLSEKTSYHVASSSPDVILNMTSEFFEIATAPINNIWPTLKIWIIDLLFFLTTAAFAMAGAWYAYFTIAEILWNMKRMVFPGDPLENPTDTPPGTVHPTAVREPRPQTPSLSEPIVEEIIDSGATSGQSDDDVRPKEEHVDLESRCQSGRLSLGVEGTTPLSRQPRMGKYRHVTKVTSGAQLRTQTGIRLHDEEKVQLCDN